MMTNKTTFRDSVIESCNRQFSEGRGSHRAPYLMLSCVFDMELTNCQAVQLDRTCYQLQPALLAGQLQSDDIPPV